MPAISPRPRAATVPGLPVTPTVVAATAAMPSSAPNASADQAHTAARSRGRNRRSEGRATSQATTAMVATAIEKPTGAWVANAAAATASSRHRPAARSASTETAPGRQP
jgi:hypothetical protein